MFFFSPLSSGTLAWTMQPCQIRRPRCLRRPSCRRSSLRTSRSPPTSPTQSSSFSTPSSGTSSACGSGSWDRRFKLNIGHKTRSIKLTLFLFQVGQMIVFACITILALVDSDSWQKTFLAVNLSAIALMNVFNAVFQGVFDVVQGLS